MQVLITGATGFLGRHLVGGSVQAGAAVRALVRPSSDTRRLESQGVDLVYGAAGDQDALRAAVNGVDLIFHAAGYLTANAPFGVDGGADDEWSLYKTINVDFTADLLQAALVAGVGRFIYVSSSSVYSPDAPVPTAEDAPLQPFSMYGRSKLLAEKHVRSYQDKGLATTIIRPPMIYGPGDRYFMPLALRLARLPLLPLVNGGRTLMDLVYVADVAQLMWLAASSDAAVGRVYNAGPGRPTTLYDLVQAYRRIAGRGPVIIPVKLGVAGRTAWLSRRLIKPLIPEAEAALTSEWLSLMSRDLHLDMSRAAEELGFQPQFDLDQGLALTLGSGA